MIVESDNTAMTLLERVLGGAKTINARSNTELNIQKLSRSPMQATTNEVAKLWLGLYNQTYLSKESNDLLLDFLLNTAPWLQDKIPAGVPAGTKVAHKIGAITTKYGMTYVDSGIVYGPKNNFIIVVLNQDVSQKDAVDKIKKITEVAYSFLLE